MHAWRSLREPTVAILLLASVVHVVRRDLFDLVLFSGTAVLILVDGGLARRSRDDEAAAQVAEDATPDCDQPPAGQEGETDVPDAAPSRRSLRRWAITAGMTLFAALAAVLAPASFGAELMLAAIGLTALVLVIVRRPRGVPAGDGSGRPDGKLAGWQVWAAIGVAACLWELTSFIAQQVWPADADSHPAVSDLVAPLLAGGVGRGVFLMLWAAAGWWLLQLWSGPKSGDELRHGRSSTRREGRSEAGR